MGCPSESRTAPWIEDIPGRCVEASCRGEGALESPVCAPDADAKNAMAGSNRVVTRPHLAKRTPPAPVIPCPNCVRVKLLAIVKPVVRPAPATGVPAFGYRSGSPWPDAYQAG